MSSYNGRKLCSKCTNALWSRGKVWLYCCIEPDAARGWVLLGTGLLRGLAGVMISIPGNSDPALDPVRHLYALFTH